MRVRSASVTRGERRCWINSDLGLFRLREIPLGLDHGLANGLDHLGTKSSCRTRLGGSASRNPPYGRLLAFVGRVPRSGLGDLLDDAFHQELVDIVTAESRVTVRRKHLEHAILDLEDRDVERAAAEIVHGDRAAVAFVQPVGQRRRGRLVDDTQNLETGEPPCISSGGALCVVEVRRNGDDRSIDLEIELTLLSEVVLRTTLQFPEHERRNLRRRELATRNADAHDSAGLATDGER